MALGQFRQWMWFALMICSMNFLVRLGHPALRALKRFMA